MCWRRDLLCTDDGVESCALRRVNLEGNPVWMEVTCFPTSFSRHPQNRQTRRHVVRDLAGWGLLCGPRSGLGRASDSLGKLLISEHLPKTTTLSPAIVMQTSDMQITEECDNRDLKMPLVASGRSETLARRPCASTLSLSIF
jgi:hypothetical protein